jgi:predicted ATPase
MFLIGMSRRPGHTPDLGAYPWTVPAIRALRMLEFHAPVTFLAGDNGSGKSTLPEGIAAGMDALAVGSHDVERDPSLAAARALAGGFRFARRKRPATSQFFRAEDVRGFTDRIARQMAEARDEAAELEAARGPNRASAFLRGSAAALADSYGEDTDARSHGETFLFLLQRKLQPGGLYLLDEPETPLSPARVLALMAMIAGAVAGGCQFIIASHSPILLALPGASILLVEGEAVRETPWNDLDSVRVTRAFLRDPDHVLRQVLAPET